MSASFWNRVSGKRPALLATAAAGMLLGIGGLASAAPIVYTSTYNADNGQLPQSSGGTTPTAANPNWNELLHATNAASVSGGTLTVTTTSETQNQAWDIGSDGASNHGAPSSAWSADPNKLTSVEFSVQVTSAGTNERPFMVDVSDGAHRMTISFGTHDLIYSPPGNVGIAHDNTVLTTYRLDFKDGKVSLYDETNNQALFTDKAGGAANNANRLIFGDFSGAYQGSFNLDSIRWTNNAAVPEPGAGSLIGGVLMMGLGLRSRKKP